MFKRLLSITALVAAVAVGAAVALLPPPAVAQTPNYAVSQPGVVVVPFHISGQYTATTAGVIKFDLPFKARVVGVQANARASGGTSPTLTVDVLAGGTTILSSAISITAGTVSHGTISTAALADEASITVDLTIGGTSPTWNDITVVLVLVRT